MRYNLHVIQGVDLARTSPDSPNAVVLPDGTVRADWMAIATIGYSFETMLVYILDCVRDQIAFPGQLALIKAQAQVWHPEVIAIESNQYQAVMAQHLFATTLLPVEEVHHSKDKEFRAGLISPHLENGRIRLRGVKDYMTGGMVWHSCLNQLVFEAINFTGSAGDVDDELDAMMNAVTKALEKMEERGENKPLASYRPGAMIGQQYRGESRF